MKGRAARFIFFLTVQLGLIATIGTALADKRVALVIGNSHYASTPTLANPANDATDVAAALTAIGFDVTLKLDATKREMDQAVAQFARASARADASLFFYTGHGLQYQGRNFVMPVDAELQDEISLRYELTSLDDVKDALQQSKGVKIMVLDACRNNPLAEKLVRSIRVGTRDIPKVQGYARPEQTAGMIIVYATQADSVAYDGTGRNSPFSNAFLKEIKEPGLEIGSMFRRVGADVYNETGGQQSPEISISLLTDYYLNQGETDQAIWSRIRATSNITAIREFLDRYPNSFYAPDAAARLELLERQTREAAANGHNTEIAAADAARLRQEQAERERIATAARAEEQDLASKLAAAETARQKLAAELAQRDAAQSEAERAHTLKAEIAQLEQQAADARAHATAEEQKAGDARKAANSAAQKSSLIASNEQGPITPSSPDRSNLALVPQIVGELRRLGCYKGVDSDWNAADTTRSVAKYALYAKLASPPNAPTEELLKDLQGRHDRLCPPDCSSREIAIGGKCVAKRCGHDESLSRSGQCVTKPAVTHDVASRSLAPARPAATGHCFVFNGNQYCE